MSRGFKATIFFILSFVAESCFSTYFLFHLFNKNKHKAESELHMIKMNPFKFYRTPTLLVPLYF